MCLGAKMNTPDYEHASNGLHVEFIITRLETFITRTVFHFHAGSLSRFVSSEDELRVYVEKLEKVVESLRQHVADSNVPEYLMNGAEEVVESTLEFPIPISEIVPRSWGKPRQWEERHPWGLQNVEHHPSQTFEWLHNMFDRLLKECFSSFPNGPYTCK
jgi:hypothetical protein